MKKRIFGLLVLAAVIGFGMASCDDGNGDDDTTGTDVFTGTWIGMDDEYPDLEIAKFVAANGSWKQYTNFIEGGTPASIAVKDVEYFRGTYTVSGSTVNLIVTEINIGLFEYGDEENEYSIYNPSTMDRWVTYANLPDEMKQEYAQTYSITISGNTFTVTGKAFTKQ